MRLFAIIAGLLLVAPPVVAQTTSFVVPVDEDGKELEETPAPRRGETPASSRRAPSRGEEERPRTWLETPTRRGVQVIEEPTATSVDVTIDELHQDRVGRPLSGAGIGIVPRNDGGSFTFKANEALDDETDEGAGTRPQQRPTRDTGVGPAPTGLLVPVEDDDFDETPAPPPPSRRNSLETGSRVGVVPQGDVLRPVERGTGAAIPVEEVAIERTGDIDARAPSSTPPPEARERTVSAPSTPAAPVETARPVAPPPAAPAIVNTPAAPDPFERLERELEEIDGPRARTTDGAPHRRRDTRSAPETPAVPPSKRDPSILGLGVSAGVGALLANDSRGVLVPQLAYGVGTSFSPGFMPELLVDLGVWRTGRTEGTSFASVDASVNHFALRVLYDKELYSNAHALVGGGVLMTLNTERYVIDDGSVRESHASFVRPGLDLSMGLAWRLRPFELRFETRVLLRGGWRLELLPALTVGGAF